MVVITGFAYTTLLERKVLARMQARVGPNRAGYIPLPGRGKKNENCWAVLCNRPPTPLNSSSKKTPRPPKQIKLSITWPQCWR
ncbi:MAG: NADH-quinone oxidoreductase subunit H [Chloroflexi bacterium]|nr:NADH-quinone oxidoreductase subunit H [Chloroflexota bacterium]